nr:hypothetical protein [Hyphomonas sp. BRH_c22]
MQYDAIVIGGSYSGIAATLQLVGARRPVLVIGAGLRRNLFASHSYGFLGKDGYDPFEIANSARRQLAAYPSLTWVEGEAVSLEGERGNFAVRTGDGIIYQGARILLATGVKDELPEFEGLAER